MTRPLVSIIIPVFNREDLIGETLESIQLQTYTNWECLIVDDHSTDQTESVVNDFCNKDARFSLLRRPDNRLKGANACRNFGFEKSIGVYINWFDSDDLMLPNKLKKQVGLLINTDYPFTVCQTQVFEGSVSNIIGLRKENIYSHNFFNDFITHKIKWLTQAPLLRRSFLLSNDLIFDEELAQSQERDFFVKVLNHVSDYSHDSTVFVLFRKHTASISYGALTKEKCKSSFTVDFRILEENNDKLNDDSRSYLKRKLKGDIRKSLQLKLKPLTNYFLSELDKLKVITPIDKIKLRIGIFTMKYFNRGALFFK